jgi:hypothetical protein
MNFNTSFGQVKLISSNIVEVIISQDIEVSLELVDEYELIMNKHFTENYAVLVNRVNNYSYAYEALLCIGSSKNLKAAAIINYGKANAQQTKNLQSIRRTDKLNVKEFSGLELGRDSAIDWLKEQLTNTVEQRNL